MFDKHANYNQNSYTPQTWCTLNKREKEGNKSNQKFLIVERIVVMAQKS